MIIKMSVQEINNLCTFLNRVDLKGAEVPAFVAIMNAISSAERGEDENGK